MVSAKLIAVGDVSCRGVPNQFDKVLPILRKGDLRFAQVEQIFSSRGTFREDLLAERKIPNYGTILYGPGLAGMKNDPKQIEEYAVAGFDVVSLASNHSMEWGPDAALDTRNAFKSLGTATIGQGANITEARKPAIFEKNGVKVGFLAYTSVSIPSGWATDTRGGIAPLRARTYYESYEIYGHPSIPAHAFSVCYEEDLEDLRKDIKAAKEQADIVVVSMHWGVHYVPNYVADYQIEAAHAAIDAGCDLILGHHPHIWHGVEVYKGKCILYSMGEFSLTYPPHDVPNDKLDFLDIYNLDLGPNLKYDRKQYGDLSAIVEADLNKDGTVALKLIPIYLEKKTRVPEPVQAGNSKFDEIIEFIEWSSKKFNTTWEIKDSRLIPQL